MRPIALALLVCAAVTAAVPPVAAQGRTAGRASLAVTHSVLEFSDSSWTSEDPWGFALRLGAGVQKIWRWRLTPLELVPHVQVAWTSVGGVDADQAYALADGEVGVQARVHAGRGFRPYVVARYPLWTTVEVERGTQRRDYALQGEHASRDWTLGAGMEVALLRTGAGVDIGVTRSSGTAGLRDVFDASVPEGNPDRFPQDETIREPYSFVRVYIGYSGPFSVIDPVPGRLW